MAMSALILLIAAAVLVTLAIGPDGAIRPGGGVVMLAACFACLVAGGTVGMIWLFRRQ